MARSCTDQVTRSDSFRKAQSSDQAERKRKFPLLETEPELRLSKQQKSASPPQVPAAAAAELASAIFPGAPSDLRADFSVESQTLGEGQFGVVRRCTCRATGEQFACKSISKARLATAADRESVRREAALLQALGARCASVTQLRAVYEDEQAVHLVQELCEGGELFDHIVRRGRLPEAEAARIFHEISTSVAVCHASGVLHRDLKPENILLQPIHSNSNSQQQYRTKLSDFGLAVPLAPGQKARGVAGSPSYMSPEVIRGEEYGLEADVWSLGVILYILLSGYPPFWGADDSAMMRSVVNSGPADVASGPWQGVSAEAKSLVRCMLQRNAARRPTSRKVLSHPWLLAHVHGSQAVRSAAAAAATVSQAVNASA